MFIPTEHINENKNQIVNALLIKRAEKLLLQLAPHPGHNCLTGRDHDMVEIRQLSA